LQNELLALAEELLDELLALAWELPWESQNSVWGSQAEA
jgi:hypothetical protein